MRDKWERSGVEGATVCGSARGERRGEPDDENGWQLDRRVLLRGLGEQVMCKMMGSWMKMNSRLRQHPMHLRATWSSRPLTPRQLAPHRPGRTPRPRVPSTQRAGGCSPTRRWCVPGQPGAHRASTPLCRQRKLTQPWCTHVGPASPPSPQGCPSPSPAPPRRPPRLVRRWRPWL